MTDRKALLKIEKKFGYTIPDAIRDFLLAERGGAVHMALKGPCPVLISNILGVNEINRNLDIEYHTTASPFPPGMFAISYLNPDYLLAEFNKAGPILHWRLTRGADFFERGDWLDHNPGGIGVPLQEDFSKLSLDELACYSDFNAVSRTKAVLLFRTFEEFLENLYPVEGISYFDYRKSLSADAWIEYLRFLVDINQTDCYSQGILNFVCQQGTLEELNALLENRETTASELIASSCLSATVGNNDRKEAIKMVERLLSFGIDINGPEGKTVYGLGRPYCVLESALSHFERFRIRRRDHERDELILWLKSHGARLPGESPLADRDF